MPSSLPSRPALTTDIATTSDTHLGQETCSAATISNPGERTPMHPTICFVIPYFGQWPFWFPFFLESCRANPDIDWILYTDCLPPENTPKNVLIRNIDYSTYCRNVSDSLEISFQPSTPYKLCDLKPALGYIHQDDLKGYDFWAFGDIDLVYGNLRNYFTSERLTHHDVFSTHQRRVSGHCCILRNTAFAQEAFMQIRDWKQLLSSPQHQWFDESAFSRLFIRHKNWHPAIVNLAKPFSRWTRCIDNQEAFSTPNARVPWIDGTHDFPQEWRWDRGLLTTSKDGGRQFPYLHFVVWKKREWVADKTVVESATLALAMSSRWSISAAGFKELL